MDLIALLISLFVLAQIGYSSAVLQTNLTLQMCGASQTVALFSQLGVIYPRRDGVGELTASLTNAAGGTEFGTRSWKLYRCYVIPGDPVGNNLLVIPQFVGTVVIVYNIPGLTGQLVLPYDVAPLIWLGDIRKWNDPRIQTYNTEILPDEDIVVLTRLDYSGGATTSIRESFASINPEWTWTGPYDPWPYSNISCLAQFEMIAEVILVPYSIGYSGYEQAIATDLNYAAIRNQNGDVVTPTPDSISAAVEYYNGPNFLNLDENYIGGSILNAPAAGAYPFAFFYYYIVKQNVVNVTDCTPYREILRFTYWSITSDLPQLLMEDSGFVPLSDDLVPPIVELMKKGTCNGEPLYGASPCDNGCTGGTCDVVGIFNYVGDICTCDVNHVNIKYTNCSEPRPASFISYSEPAGSSLSALSAIFAAYTVAVMAAIWYYRKLPLIKALSPIFCIITLVGLLFEYAGIFVLVGQPSSVTCSLEMWFLSLPAAVIFAAMIVKQYRLVTVFENTKRVSMGIKNKHLIVLIFVIIFPCLIFLILYSTIVQPAATRTLNPVGEYVWTCSATNLNAQTALFILLGLYHLLSMAFSVFLALKGRSIRDEFNESRATGVVVYLLTTVCIITIIILSLPQLPSRVRFAVRAISILFCSLAFTIILFLKPIKGIQSTRKNAELSKTKTSKSENSKIKMVNKDGVMIAATATDGSKVSNGSDSESEDDVDAGPVKKIKEDAWKWQAYARPRRFLERWRRCHLTFHKELSMISLIQRSNLNDRSNTALTVCFPIKAIKLVYRGFNVTGGSQSNSFNLFNNLTGDAKDSALEGLVVEFHITTGESYAVQLKSLKQAEQVVGLFTGTTLKDTDTAAHTSSRHGPSSKSGISVSQVAKQSTGKTSTEQSKYTDVTDEDEDSRIHSKNGKSDSRVNDNGSKSENEQEKSRGAQSTLSQES